MDYLLQELTNESRWIAPAVILALATGWIVSRKSNVGSKGRTQILLDGNAGLLLLILGLGHIIAVTIKIAQSTLDGSLMVLYGIGVVLAIPGALLLVHAIRSRSHSSIAYRRSRNLNGLSVAALLVTGPLNLPLAIPSILAAAFAVHRRKSIGLAIMIMFTVFTILFMVGSIKFFLSGRSFEEFSGM